MRRIARCITVCLSQSELHRNLNIQGMIWSGHIHWISPLEITRKLFDLWRNHEIH